MVVDYALLIKAIRKTLITDQTRPDQISRLGFYVLLDFFYYFYYLYYYINVREN